MTENPSLDLQKGSQGGEGWIHIRSLSNSSRGDLLITCPIGPHKTSVTILVDTGAQVSALNIEDASSRRITPSQKSIRVTDGFGNTQTQMTAKVRCWLPGEEKALDTLTITGEFPTNSLGPDLLKGRSWTSEEGKTRTFGQETSHLRLLSSAPALPPSLVSSVKPSPLPLGAREGITPLIGDLKEKGIVIATHSPYSAPVWPVRKPNGQLETDSRLSVA